MSVLALFTCFNRKEKTEQCIHSIVKANPECDFTFVVADDGSTDGTVQVLERLKLKYNIHVLHGNGSLFYSGGMRLAMKYVKQEMSRAFDYILLMNDDVVFLNSSVERMILQSKEQNHAIIVGGMKNEDGSHSYGAVKYTRGIKYKILATDEWEIEADTFNANAVLIPWRAFCDTEIVDEHYVHTLGDFDYGLSLRNNGYKIYTSKDYVGICNNNSAKGTWTDSSLPRKVRIQKKENPKGAPARQWFYFLKKILAL